MRTAGHVVLHIYHKDCSVSSSHTQLKIDRERERKKVRERERKRERECVCTHVCVCVCVCVREREREKEKERERETQRVSCVRLCVRACVCACVCACMHVWREGGRGRENCNYFMRCTVVFFLYITQKYCVHVYISNRISYANVIL